MQPEPIKEIQKRPPRGYIPKDTDLKRTARASLRVKKGPQGPSFVPFQVVDDIEQNVVMFLVADQIGALRAIKTARSKAAALWLDGCLANWSLVSVRTRAK